MARDHSENMSREGYFSHTTPDGKRLRGPCPPRGHHSVSCCAENIAYNQGYEDSGSVCRGALDVVSQAPRKYFVTGVSGDGDRFVW
jgi:hypothetical protein